MKHQSIRGLSIVAFELEVIGYTIALAYCLHKGLPFSAYGELAFLLVQGTDAVAVHLFLTTLVVILESQIWFFQDLFFKTELTMQYFFMEVNLHGACLLLNDEISGSNPFTFPVAAIILVAIIYYFSQPLGMKTWIRALLYPTCFSKNSAPFTIAV